MVIARIIGGLGNQMFQYATGFRLAKKLQTEFKIDTSAFATYPLHRLSITKLSISATTAEPREIAPYITHPPTSLWSRLHRLLTRPAPKVRSGYFHEPKFSFNTELLTLTGDVIYLDGYWQSEKYFIDVAEDIRREFQVPTEPDETNKRMLELIRTTESVCLHIRRGDYVQNQNTNSIHGTASLDYYYQALKQIQSKHQNPELFVFSDDLDWVRQNLRNDFRTIYVDQNGPEKDFEDLRLMSACKHHIIANSTFSWWGAWLGQRPGQIVVAPKKWFSTTDFDSKDLVPSRWYRL